MNSAMQKVHLSSGYVMPLVGCKIDLLKLLILHILIDLYLIHWPGATRIPESSMSNPNLRALTWKKLVELKKQGLLRSIGVSNYTISHLEELLQDCEGVPPAVNQVR